jgi:hypothetical protein
MCRYPTSSAVDTAGTICLAETRHTPKPSCGIIRPLFSDTFGTLTACTPWVVLSGLG